MLTSLPAISPTAAGAFSEDPGASFVTSALRAPLGSSLPAVARAARLSSEGGQPADGLVEALARAALTPAERHRWQAERTSPRRRRQWLLGRLAAKDAARVLLREVTGVVVLPTEVEVVLGAHGRPEVSVTGLPAAHGLHISIAHTGEIALALASMDPTLAGVGIDVERVRPRRALERKGLTAGERRRLENVPAKRRLESVLRWWCAKEATAKALGEGLDRLGGAASMSVIPLREDSGLVAVQLRPTFERRYDRLLAATECDGDFVVATLLAQRRSDHVDHPPPA